MTTTAPASSRHRSGPRRNRRWLRAVLPFAVLLALITATVVAHLIEQPDPTDASFLSPVSSADDGADRLAARLAGNRVSVERQTSTSAALESARTGRPATLFVTTPELVYRQYLRQLTLVPAGTRVVLVAPDATTLSAAGVPITVAGSRWAAAAPEPACADPVAGAAGPAAVQRMRYDPAGTPAVRCYAGGMVRLERGDATVTVVGAADPFRNDRLDEHGNAALAVGLLSRTPRVIWLDLHERETPPRRTAPTGAPGQPVPGPGDESGEESPGDESGDGDQGPPPQEPPEQDGPDGALADSPLARAFPAQLWAVVFLLALAVIALAAASARRLGAPVSEPLPVRVRATETVQGHGRLYQRARARGPSLDVLRSAARHRIAEQLGMPLDSSTDAVAQRTAEHTGRSPEQVREVLDGAAPGTDDELVDAAIAVQHLVRDVAGPQARPQLPNEGDAP